jgi:Meiotically up-regulated gene 113
MNAKLDPTFLMADVEVVATYGLYNINRTELENLIHRIFDSARLDIEIKDRFGQPVIPREWYLVPLFVIDEATKPETVDRALANDMVDAAAVEQASEGSIMGRRLDFIGVLAVSFSKIRKTARQVRGGKRCCN